MVGGFQKRMMYDAADMMIDLAIISPSAVRYGRDRTKSGLWMAMTIVPTTVMITSVIRPWTNVRRARFFASVLVSAGKGSGLTMVATSGGSGLIYWSTPTRTVGLVVEDAVVVAWPDSARSWAARRDARQLWRQLARQHSREPERYKLTWIPDPAMETVEHWWNGSWGRMMRRDLKLRTDGSTWRLHVRLGEQSIELKYRDEDVARRELDVLLSERGPWKRLRSTSSRTVTGRLHQES